jgi:hypothetical protein
VVDPVLQWHLNEPLGSKELQKQCSPEYASAEAREMARRVSKIYLPAGKRPTSGPAVREKKDAFYALQVDLEDVVEAAGGKRGSART